MRKLETAKERYAVECAGGERTPVLESAHQEMIKAVLARHRDNSAVTSMAMTAVSIGGKLCTSVGIPRVHGDAIQQYIESSEQLLFEDALDIALDLTAEAARQALEAEWAMREAEQQAERDRIEIERATHARKVQAAKDARWSHLTPTAAAAFRLAAKHSSGVIGELARAIIASETEPRRGEMQLPEDLDALLWRLTADKLTHEERELVGLSRK